MTVPAQGCGSLQGQTADGELEGQAVGQPLRYHLDRAENGDRHPLLRSCRRHHQSPAQGLEHQRDQPVQEGANGSRDSCSEDGGPAS